MKPSWFLIFLIIYFGLVASSAQASTTVNSADSVQGSDSPTLDLLNVRIRPIEAFFGSPGIDLDVGLNPSWSLGPSLQFFKNSLSSSTTFYFEAGAQATYYLSHERFENSWFARAGFYFLRYDLESSRADGTSLNYFITSGVVGYDFRLTASGLNTTIGTGLSVFTNSKETGVEPILEWSVGWAL
jgi:hypothetical protein